jgi:hypothetical protein
MNDRRAATRFAVAVDGAEGHTAVDGAEGNTAVDGAEVHAAVDGRRIDTANAPIADLVAVASALRLAGVQAAPAGLSTHFRAELRQRLVAVATVQDALPLAGVPEPPRGRLRFGVPARRRVAALASVAMVATAVSGVAVAASRSLPGEPFYGVKRATENVQLFFTPGVGGKGRRHLEFAATRLAEARKLHDPSASRLGSTLRDMDDQIRDGRNDLIAAYRSSHSAQPLVELNTFSRDELRGLASLANQLPASLRALEAPSVQLVTQLGSEVRRLAVTNCATCLVPGAGLPGRSGSPQPRSGISGHRRHTSGGNGGTGNTGRATTRGSRHRVVPTRVPVPTPSSTTSGRSLLPTPVPSILRSLLPSSAPVHVPTKVPSTLPKPSKLPLPSELPLPSVPPLP